MRTEKHRQLYIIDFLRVKYFPLNINFSLLFIKLILKKVVNQFNKPYIDDGLKDYENVQNRAKLIQA